MIGDIGDIDENHIGEPDPSLEIMKSFNSLMRFKSFSTIFILFFFKKNKKNPHHIKFKHLRLDTLNSEKRKEKKDGWMDGLTYVETLRS